MNENPSWVCFRELTGPGPLGALGVPVTGRTSVAADPKYVPLGAPVVLSLDRAEPNGLWIAQDTGGAIKRSEEHTSELQSLMRISYAVFCLKKKNSTRQVNRNSKQKPYKHATRKSKYTGHNSTKQTV